MWGNTPESVCGNISYCLTDLDPLFVHDGAFDFARFVTVEIGGVEHSLPDFIVEPPDYHLQPGSPAIDAGESLGAPTTDIEGRGRPCGAGVDIGAYEHGDCSLSPERFQRGDVDANGALEITDPIHLLGYLFLGQTEPPCLDAGDVDDSGELDISDAVYNLSFQFLGGPDPVAPFEACGTDGTVDDLGCARFPPCEATP